ncbi:MAG: tetratricopeptide repeat protein, partial [Candidatus Omnitrophica bacterium]|nr:tetratricopeptide repeat protein [Candidatus Omnitrophota bacterium]
KLLEAEKSFKKAIELNPKNDWAYLRLGNSYLRHGKLLEAEKSFKKAIELNPKNDWAYLRLGNLYLEQGKLLEAEKSFKKAIEFTPKNDRIYGALEIIYKATGNQGYAREYGQKAKDLRSSYYNLITTNNYHKLKAILDKRGIKYVCVQYPMRNLEPLKKVFQGGAEGIVFVDNEKIFKDAVKKANYRVYFVDIFGGDFGHCTEKGNRLLAENIANTILKEVFHK